MNLPPAQNDKQFRFRSFYFIFIFYLFIFCYLNIQTYSLDIITFVVRETKLNRMRNYYFSFFLENLVISLQCLCVFTHKKEKLKTFIKF